MKRVITPHRRTLRRALVALASLVLATTGVVAVAQPAFATIGWEFKNLKSGLCLDFAGRGAIQNTCSQTSPIPQTQVWFFEPSNQAHYWLLEDLEGACLAIDANSTAQGARAVRTSCDSTPNRMWHPLTISVVNGVTIYEMVNVNSGLCLTDDNGSTAAGHIINQSTCTHVSAQRWFPGKPLSQ